MLTIAMCINFLFLFIRSSLSSLLSFSFLLFSFCFSPLRCSLSALLSFPQSQVNGSLLCSLSLIGGSPICGGGCLRTVLFWWVGGCHGILWRGFGFANVGCGGFGFAGVGIVGLGGLAWVWVCRYGFEIGVREGD